MRKILYIFIISTILAQDTFKTILEDILLKKASIQIYCLSPLIFFYTPPSQEEIREIAKSNTKHQYTAFYSYSQYQNILRFFLKQHNLSVIQTFIERKPYISCVVDIIYQNKIIHTLSFSQARSEDNKLIDRVIINNKPYLLKESDITKTFQLLFCPNANEYKNNNFFENKQKKN